MSADQPSNDYELWKEAAEGAKGEAHARRTDPDTSHKSAKIMVESERAAKLEAKVYRTVAESTGLICTEICDIAGEDWNTISPRLAPLIRDNLIHDSGERRVNPKTNHKQRVLKAGPAPPELANRKKPLRGMLKWAVDKWHAEVGNRPLDDVHRRILDDMWRQVIRRAGGDPLDLVGETNYE